MEKEESKRNDTDIANHLHSFTDSNEVKSFIDSRTLDPLPSSIHLSEVDDGAEALPSRYLSRTNASTNAASTSFEKAFASIRNTESFLNPPLPVSDTISRSQVTNKSNQQGNVSTSGSHRSNHSRDLATVVYVNRCQTGNPLLKAVKNVSLEFKDGLLPDYVMGESSCMLFLSIRYHLLHGSYLEERLNRVRKEDVTNYRTKVILCYVDVEDNEVALKQINRLAVLSDFTLVLAWSWAEAARYLETFKAYENKSASLIKEKIEADFIPQVNDVLTSIRSINKTDVITLLTTFSTVQGIMNTSMEELALCPGLGEKKVQQLLETFQEPFIKTKKIN
jgi:DNA excision repair protein ERCC-1